MLSILMKLNLFIKTIFKFFETTSRKKVYSRNFDIKILFNRKCYLLNTWDVYVAEHSNHKL
jgi:hypothetical protein